MMPVFFPKSCHFLSFCQFFAQNFDIILHSKPVLFWMSYIGKRPCPSERAKGLPAYGMPVLISGKPP